jgi:predicted DNA-binding transcriptional regulator YafY
VQRLERLINLVAALLETPRPLRAEELRERVPGYPDETAAFRRAFERDKEALREMGVPVVAEPVDPSAPTMPGYRIPKDEYYLRDPGLAPDELAALHLAASAVQLEGVRGVEALWKLGGWVEEEGPPPAIAALPGAAHLGVLFEAVSGRRPVSFVYRGEARRVDPWRLSFRNGHWYLAGRDHVRGGERNYRLERIESEVAVDRQAPQFDRPPPAGGQPQPWEMGAEEEVTARLLVDAEQAGWASTQVGAGAVEEQRKDGSVVLAVPVTNRAAFRSFVLGFLDHAEVLAPPELRAELTGWLAGLCPS